MACSIVSLPSRQEVYEWALEMQVPPLHTLAVGQVPVDTATYDMRVALKQHPNLQSTVKIKILCRRKDANKVWCSVLVNVGHVITKDEGPDTLWLVGELSSRCPVIYPEMPIKSEPSSSHTNLKEVAMKLSPPFPGSFCEDDISTISDSNWCLSVGSPCSSRMGDIQLLAKVIHQLEVSKTESPFQTPYRKLEIFSGTIPTPTGEEAFEVWKDYTLQVLDEWTCPDPVKRQRIMECLRPSASTMIKMYKNQHAEVTAQRMMESLNQIYGREEDVSELMSKYYHLSQREGEDLSDFIHRIQLILWDLRSRNAIKASEVNEYRRTQFLQGAIPTHHIVVMIRRSLLKGEPPTLEDLLDIVKGHEAYTRLDTPKKTKELLKSDTQGASATKVKKSPSREEETPPKTLCQIQAIRKSFSHIQGSSGT
ncbi:paraneoplastic antigen Ma2 homolog [Ascaphus truei]|uniref:paraneoplastic antigen Ma2 homolog n=1 Tax=Ascaphus truei TaxID=8439 RepID=UPI003F5A8A8A